MFSRIADVFNCQPNLNAISDQVEEIVSINNIKEFGGVNYELIKLDDKTPILFQWFVDGAKHQYANNGIPILNTHEHPYLDNIINTAKIEKDRMIFIFFDADITEGQLQSLLRLEVKFSNIKILFCNEIDFSQFDVKISDIYKKNIEKIGQTDEWLRSKLEKEMNSGLFGDQTLISWHKKNKGHPWFDFFRNLILLKGCSVFKELNKNYNLNPALGFIYLDVDMVIKKKFNDIYLPDGIGIFVDKGSNGEHILENGIIAVDRSMHPALLKGLDIMHSEIGAHPYNDGLCKGLKHHFNYYSKPNYQEFAAFIKFNDECLSTNTSRQTSSSWK